MFKMNIKLFLSNFVYVGGIFQSKRQLNSFEWMTKFYRVSLSRSHPRSLSRHLGYRHRINAGGCIVCNSPRTTTAITTSMANDCRTAVRGAGAREGNENLVHSSRRLFLCTMTGDFSMPEKAFFFCY